MSWKDNLLDASYRDVVLEVMRDDLDVRRSLAQHGMPYRDGDTVEDLGRQARRFQLSAVFYGADYERGLQALLKTLNTPGSAPLVHPIYGHLTVMAERWQVKHQAERPDYAEVRLSLVEAAADPQFFQRVFTPAEGAADMAASHAPDWRDKVRDLLSRISTLDAQVQTWLGGGYVGLVEQLLGLPGVNLRLAQLRSQVRGVLVGMADVARASVPSSDPLSMPATVPVDVRRLAEGSLPRVRTAAGTTGNLAAPIDTARLVTGGGVPAHVPGSDSLPGEVSRAWQVVLTNARQATAPRLHVNGDASSGSLVVPDGFPDEPVAAQGWALVSVAVTCQALTLAGAVAQVLDGQRTAPTLTPSQLEHVLGQARGLLEGSICLHRRLYGVEQAREVIEPLRNVAALLQAATRQVLLVRPPLLQRTVDADACLRLLAFRWYGDNARAAELLRLNPQLKQPYAIASGEVLRAYAQ